MFKIIKLTFKTGKTLVKMSLKLVKSATWLASIAVIMKAVSKGKK